MYISIDWLADFEYSSSFEQGIFKYDGITIIQLVNAVIESFIVFDSFIIYKDFEDKLIKKYHFDTKNISIFNEDKSIYPYFNEMHNCSKLVKKLSLLKAQSTIMFIDGFERKTIHSGYDFYNISIMHGNGENDGYNPYELKAFDKYDKEIWTINFDIINSDRNKIKPFHYSENLMIDDKILIIGFESDGLIAIDKDTGNIIWYKVDFKVNLMEKYDNSIYIFDTKRLVEINSYTGEITKERNIEEEIKKYNYINSLPMLVTEDFIFITSDNESNNFLLIKRENFEVIDMLITPGITRLPGMRYKLKYYKSKICIINLNDQLKIFEPEIKLEKLIIHNHENILHRKKL
ncbi:MAG: hypothetical protein R2771_15510 [Saprospiraceae bacterium]